MSEIENKILGKKEKEQAPAAPKNDLFAADRIWEVTKEGCGVSTFNGKMVYEMLDFKTKELIKDGAKTAQYNGFSFKLVK